MLLSRACGMHARLNKFCKCVHCFGPYLAACLQACTSPLLRNLAALPSSAFSCGPAAALPYLLSGVTKFRLRFTPDVPFLSVLARQKWRAGSCCTVPKAATIARSAKLATVASLLQPWINQRCQPKPRVCRLGPLASWSFSLTFLASFLRRRA